MIEKEASEKRRCPRCHKLALQYDPDLRRIVCSSCGYVAHLQS